jgi:hypothetical protein
VALDRRRWHRVVCVVAAQQGRDVELDADGGQGGASSIGRVHGAPRRADLAPRRRHWTGDGVCRGVCRPLGEHERPAACDGAMSRVAGHSRRTLWSLVCSGRAACLTAR